MRADNKLPHPPTGMQNLPKTSETTHLPPVITDGILWPKISIITAVYNSQNYLSDCIESVINQNYPNLEHIFVDGLSTDNSLDIIKKYAEQCKHIRYVSEKDTGIYDAINKGIELSTGDWIYVFGSDDVFFDNDVLQSIFSLQENKKYDVIYGDVLFKTKNFVYDGEFNPYKLLFKNICHQAIFYKKKLHNKFGKYEINYKLYADWNFNLQWLNCKSVKNKYVERTIALYNDTGLSNTDRDENFINNKEKLYYRYVPWFVYFMYRKRNNPVIRRIIWRLWDE
jgi:glycosyltransferase involved in cell wall biosynthesis